MAAWDIEQARFPFSSPPTPAASSPPPLSQCLSSCVHIRVTGMTDSLAVAGADHAVDSSSDTLWVAMRGRTSHIVGLPARQPAPA
eukprot:357105-Chlamydomonas_euryale.AAC.5